MKQFLLLALCTALTHLAAGRENNPDSLYSGLLIVPFPSTMYLSDSDREIAEGSDMGYEAIRSRFRLGLDISFAVRLQEWYGDHSLLRDTLGRAGEDLLLLYRTTKYAYAFTPENLEQKGGKGAAEKKGIPGNFFGRARQKEKKPEAERGLFGDEGRREGPAADKEGSYMQATLRDPAVLTELSEIYGTELFLFLNQFEINMRFDDCIDFENKIYNREIRVHYDLFRADGVRLTGGVLVSTFPSSVNDVTEIIHRYFPGMTDGFNEQIPVKLADDK